MELVFPDDQRMEVELRRAERKTLAVTVRPDGTVLVRAPLCAGDELIRRWLTARAAWIQEQQRFFAQFDPRTPARNYVPGESHLFLGRRYRLRLAQRDVEEVKRSGGYLWLHTREPQDGDAVRAVLDRWYEVQAREIFPTRLERRLRGPAGLKVAPPRLQIRRMRRRWGSLSASGRLILNVDLVRAPLACIDYVITHELCHMHHANHSTEFFRLLQRVMPDWEQRKVLLEQLLS